jgi:hypothetical protein
MQDAPRPDQLLEAVVRFLRDDALPALGRHGEATLAYQARVAANMLDIARRELTQAPAADAAELARLTALVGEPGETADLGQLNRRLAERIASGQVSADTAGLSDHLWASTLAKLAVDQPSYETYRRLGGAAD